jgi:hypothetical protein
MPSVNNILTPMLFQYVVGLCCLRRDPDAVDVVIGDSVPDIAAGIQRDVDVTVTLREADGSLRAFKGYEVKRESARLDVTEVEQLCMKFMDMPAVTHRAIVSASGFTSAGVAKAQAHGVSLYERCDWTQPVSALIPELDRMGAPEDVFRFRTVFLVWREPTFYVATAGGPAAFRWESSTPLLDSHGSSHREFATMGVYLAAVRQCSVDMLWSIEPIKLHATPELRNSVDELGAIDTPPLQHSHTLDVAKDEVFMSLGGALVRIAAVTISGILVWQIRRQVPQFFVLKDAVSGEVFSSTAIAQSAREGRFMALMFAPGSREFQFRDIALAERHRNAIRKLSLLHVATR